MSGVPAYQEPEARKGWFTDYDGVPTIYVHPDDVEVYTINHDQSLGADEYIASVSWASEGPTFTSPTVAARAQGTIIFDDVPLDGQYLTLNDTQITAKDTPTEQDHFQVGGLFAVEDIPPLAAAAINNGSESSNAVAVDNGDLTITVTWLEYGTAGNDAVFALGGSYTQWTVDGAGFLGGTTIGVGAGGNRPIDGKSHSVTVTGAGDGVVTVTKTDGTSFKRRFRWKSCPRRAADY